jgi:hypothetical protein
MPVPAAAKDAANYVVDEFGQISCAPVRGAHLWWSASDGADRGIHPTRSSPVIFTFSEIILWQIILTMKFRLLPSRLGI